VNFAGQYLEKHGKVSPHINCPSQKGLKYIVTIPAYLETSLDESLVSLFSCTPPDLPVEVIIAFNWPENDTPANKQINRDVIDQTDKWIKSTDSSWIRFHYFVLPDINKKISGVGYARKMAMDEAVRRFIKCGQDDGIILSFDSDTTCDPDYFVRIESHFRENPGTDGCTIYFEHPITGDVFSPAIYEGITQYELHLRYYLWSTRSAGFPNAFYTVGSAFAVRAGSYCRQGGMNTRKAGEDFYFLQKFFDLGNFSELNSTRVIPSPRPSSRVPFGTGAKINDFIKGNDLILSYNPRSFDILRDLFGKLDHLYELSPDFRYNPELFSDDALFMFLKTSEFRKKIKEIKNNSGNYDSFRKRFFRYFNMFRIMKFLNSARNYYPDLPVDECARIYLGKCGFRMNPEIEARELLRIFRDKDRGFIPPQ